MGPPSVRPWRTPAVTSAVSRSIFIRPPRPWPSWRRAMSRLIASRSSSSPAGSPSTMQVSPGPWLSPAVTKRSDTPGSLFGYADRDDVDARRRAAGEPSMRCRGAICREMDHRAESGACDAAFPGTPRPSARSPCRGGRLAGAGRVRVLQPSQARSDAPSGPSPPLGRRSVSGGRTTGARKPVRLPGPVVRSEWLGQRDGRARDRGAQPRAAALERAGGGVPAVARRTVRRDTRVEQAAAGLRAGLRPRGGRRAALVDLHEVELVLGADAAGLVEHVE